MSRTVTGGWRVLLAAATVAGCAEAGDPPAMTAGPQPPPSSRAAPAAADGTPLWQIEQLTCRDLLAAPTDDQAGFALFYYGYLAGRTNIRAIRPAQIEPNITRVVQYCVANPTTPVVQAFVQALGVQAQPPQS